MLYMFGCSGRASATYATRFTEDIKPPQGPLRLPTIHCFVWQQPVLAGCRYRWYHRHIDRPYLVQKRHPQSLDETPIILLSNPVPRNAIPNLGTSLSSRVVHAPNGPAIHQCNSVILTLFQIMDSFNKNAPTFGHAADALSQWAVVDPSICATAGVFGGLCCPETRTRFDMQRSSRRQQVPRGRRT